MTSTPSDVPLPQTAPSLVSLVGESRGAVQPARLVANARRLARVRTRDTRPVMVIPGLGTNDLSTWPRRQWLASKGHRCVGWGLGVNRGDPELVLDTCTTNVEKLAVRTGTKVHLIGCRSLQHASHLGIDPDVWSAISLAIGRSTPG
jgi:hypothetical protein